MEVFLYNSTVCRLCGEENDNGTFLYSPEENSQNISELVNAYLPIKVSDDGQLPRTICPGCTIQLEATVEFINLIINGQKTIRSLYDREKEYMKTVFKSTENKDVTVSEVNENGAYPEDHPISLQVAGLNKPKRKRGRPPKKPKTPEEIAQEAAAKEAETKAPKPQWREAPTGKRKRKTPERFKEVVQGKELEMIFIEEGVTDGEETETEVKPEKEEVPKEPVLKVPEVIGHTDSGELVVVVKGKGRGRPKGRLRPSRSVCSICGLEFSCAGRYMSHVAAHGAVLYECAACGERARTRLAFTDHQQRTGHAGQHVLPAAAAPAAAPAPAPAAPARPARPARPELPAKPDTSVIPDLVPIDKLVEVATRSLPDLNPPPEEEESEEVKTEEESVATEDGEAAESPTTSDPKSKQKSESPTKAKHKLKCPYCDNRYSSKQSKSLHIKAVHRGIRGYSCAVCGASFAYPRSLALHALAHSRRRAAGYGCDLCGKVLNHPSSVAYHKEAEHANQRYVCNKCGKSFKHRQLLQRHQLVHTQHRPYTCKTCNAKFKTKANLINHQLLHSGVKKFSCEICKQKFAHKTSLTLHVRWHNGQKPFVCKICNKAFSQKGNLSEHLRIHTGEKPFQCALCLRRFTTSSQHRLHLRRHQTISERDKAVSKAESLPAVVSDEVATVTTVPADLVTYSKLSQVQKQISLLAPAGSRAASPLEAERVIYVAYEVDGEPAYQLLDAPDEAEEVEESSSIPECSLYAGDSLLQSPDKLDMETMVQEHMPVTDEEGNPLHFTMQDGTRLAITSLDGHSLHVITQDGQTIPVEINGFTPEHESSM